MPGVPGELCIRRRAVAWRCGYVNQPELTAGRFIQFSVAGVCTARRGSRLVQRPDGQFKFLGRLDLADQDPTGCLVAPEKSKRYWPHFRGYRG